MLRRLEQRVLALTGCLFILATAAGFGQDKSKRAETVSADVHWNLVFIGPEQAVPIAVTVSADEGAQARRLKLAAMLLQRFDADKDGKLSSTEAALLPQRAKASGPGLGDQWKTLDRSPTDDSLSAEELAVFVNEQLGPEFQLSTRPPRLAQSVELVPRLDGDHDQAISSQELLGGMSLLRQADLDDDEAVSIAELQPNPRRQVPGRQVNPQANPTPVFPVNAPEEVSIAVRQILNAFGSDGQGESVPVTRIQTADGKPELFDANQDGRLNAEELSLWAQTKQPVVRITAALAQRRPSTVQIEEGTTKTPAGAKASTTLGGAAVEVNAMNNRTEQTDSTKLYRVRFLTADQNKNGYIEETEFPTLQLPAQFKDVDANGDGMLMRDELTTFVEFDAIALQARIELMVGEEGKTLFELLDANTDRRLTMREIREGFTRLASIDRNHDERVAQSELESRYRFTFSFGRNMEFSPTANPQGMLVTPRLRSQNTGPIWYRRMDRNLDGDITWREFLGSREQFSKLDQNTDELIDLNEANAAPEPSTGKN
jgi:Ca2+-binding EF-hand superfamily protein